MQMTYSDSLYFSDHFSYINYFHPSYGLFYMNFQSFKHFLGTGGHGRGGGQLRCATASPGPAAYRGPSGSSRDGQSSSGSSSWRQRTHGSDGIGATRRKRAKQAAGWHQYFMGSTAGNRAKREELGSEQFIGHGSRRRSDPRATATARN